MVGESKSVEEEKEKLREETVIGKEKLKKMKKLKKYKKNENREEFRATIEKRILYPLMLSKTN